MKILWVGDACVQTGFAACTHAVCDELHAAGHEVRVLGINYYGDPHGYPYKVYPCEHPLEGGRDMLGEGRLPRMCVSFKPDVVVLLNDPWNVPGYLRAMQKLPREQWPLIVPWLAVDGANQHAKPLNDTDHVVVWTEWARDELRRGGYSGDCSVVPLGVDCSIYHPRGRDESRAEESVFPLRPDGSPAVPSDVFLVGAVGRNQYRKRLDLTVKFFAEWVKSHAVQDAWLYMHCAPTGDGGVDLMSMARYYGLQGRLVISTPHISHGPIAEHMARLYSGLDVYITTTQGEGWGLPALEAMACGAPVIAPDWSGLGSWARGAAMLVPCSSTALTAPVNGSMHTVGGVADRAAFIEALDSVYRSSAIRERMRTLSLQMAARLPWRATAEGMVNALERVYEARRRPALAGQEQEAAVASA